MVEKIYKEIGKRIRKFRKAQGKKQIPFAKSIKMSRASLVNIELGCQRIMMHDVAKFSKALRVTPARLVRGLWP